MRFKIIFTVIFLIISSCIYFFTKQLIDNSKQAPQQKVEVNISEEKNLNEVVEKNGIKYFQTKGLNIALFSAPLEYKFTQKEAKGLDEQSKSENYKLAFNSSYFKGSYSDAQHAGLLQINGNLISQQGKDAQLTHIVGYDSESNSLKFEEVVNFSLDNYKDKKYTLFQTGPLVIQDNKISSEYINSSLNGQGSYIRTLIGYTETEKFVVITTRFYKLEDVANEILNLEIFKEKKVNLMNLDGGPSTAIYSKDYSEINFNETKKLPLVIGVK